MKDDDFFHWKTEGYVPTARLDGRTDWVRVKNLRRIGLYSPFACPHTIQDVIGLELLHTAIKTRTFYDSAFQRDDYVIYVSMIHRDVIDWFSRHTLAVVHDQIVEAVAIGYVMGDWAESHIHEDVCSLYLDRVKTRITTLRTMNEEAQQDVMVEAKTTLPPWLAPVDCHGTLLPASLSESYGRWPWKRPGRPIADELGIISYGLSRSDEEGLDAGRRYLDYEAKRLTRTAKPNKEHFTIHHQHWAQDDLQRCESSTPPYDFLLYARHRKEAWPHTSIADQQVGRVYLLQDGQGRVKIGWTDGDPESRAAACQTGNADRLIILGSIPGDRRVEGALHSMFSHLKVRDERTEWFLLKPSDVIKILSS